MAILNEEILNINLNKMKFYYKECSLDIDSLINNFNLNGIYNTKNTITINEFATNVIRNLKTINQNLVIWVIIMVDEITKKNYLLLEQKMIKLNQEIDELVNMNQKLINKMEDTLILDKKIIKEEEFNTIKETYLKNKNIITSNIIPNIERKIS